MTHDPLLSERLHDGSLSVDERAALAERIRVDGNLRRQLADERILIRRLSALLVDEAPAAVADRVLHLREAARPSRVIKLVSAVRKRQRPAARAPVWRWAAAAAVVLLVLGGWWTLRAHPSGGASPIIAHLRHADSGVQVLRAGVTLTPASDLPLRSGDRLQTSATSSAAAEVYFPDHTVLAAMAGTTFRLGDEDGAKRVRLDQGEVRCEVAKQPTGKAMRLLTAHAEVEVVGTRFNLRVAAEDTRLEVAEGLVSLKKNGDATAVLVAAEHFAVAKVGVPLAAVRMPQSTPTPQTVTAPTHGQDIQPGMVGRVGAAAQRLADFTADLETIAGAQVISSSRTVRNKRFTDKVLVTGGEVTFEFCSFEYVPQAIADAQLQHYHRGRNAGRIICNWCDFDSGLRGAQGRRETCNVQLGELGMANPPTVGARATLYRCRLQGCGNGIGLHRYRSAGTDITECLIGSLTHGDDNHSEGVEIRSSDNITLQRSRIVVDTTTDQSCLIITPSLGTVASAQPIIIQDCYLAGGAIPVITTRYGDDARADAGGSSEHVRFIGNRFGDASQWGRLCNFNHLDVTHDAVYAAANPRVIYWARSNVWAPDGEGVSNPAKAPSGDAPAGQPHQAGGFVDARNFFGGETWTWDGKVVP